MKISSISFRRKLSYVLLPAMILYTFQPYISYGGEARVIVTGKGSSGEEPSAAAERDMATAVELNRKNSHRKLLRANEEKAPTASKSMASGYTMGVGAQVNRQTGQLDVTFNNVKLTGMSEETALDLGISNGGGSKRIYGMVEGWKFNLDYIDSDGEKKLCMNGQQSLVLDPGFSSIDSEGKEYYSGLRYYTSKAVKFGELREEKALPYPKEQPEEKRLKYKHILTSSSGCHEYFDSDGKLICQDDRFGNNIIYEYEGTGTPFECSLKRIIDSFGQNIGVKCGANAVVLTLPDGRRASYDFSSGDSITVKGADGRSVILSFKYVKGEKKVSSIKYPAGGETSYDYTEQAIPFNINGKVDYFCAVTEEVQDPGKGGKRLVTKYNYNANIGSNFTGNPLDYNACGKGRDPLMQSNNNAYRYETKVISERDKDCGGDITTSQTFNFLHLPLKGEIWDADGKLLGESYTHYLGDSGEEGSENFPDYDHLHSNYNLPGKVTTKVSGISHSIETGYDDYGRAVKVVKCNREKPVSVVTTAYGKYDLIVNQKEKYKDDKEAWTEKTLVNTLGGGGKYVSRSVAALKGKQKVTDVVLDSNGREEKATLSDALESGVSAYSPNSSSIRSKYERSGNFLRVTNENDERHKTSKTIDIRNGRIIEEKDANGNIIKYSYPENSDLVVEKSYPDGSWEKTDNSDPEKSITSYSNDMVITSLLDGFGRVIKESDNFGRSVSTEYNQLGKPSKKTDMFGQVVTYTYDYQGRAIRIIDYIKEKPNNKIVIEYNDADQTATTCINGIKSAVSYYDDSGNIKSRINCLEDQKPTQETEYNGQNLAMNSQLILGKEKLLSLKIDEYDLEGRPLKSSTNTKDGVNGKSDVIYSLFGDVISKEIAFTSAGPGRELGTGKVKGETRKYNKIGMLESLIDQEGKRILYSYDPNGNLICMEDFAGNEIKYEYDDMNRMRKMSCPGYEVENTYYRGKGPSQGQLESRVLKKDGTETDRIEYKYDDHGRLSTISTNGKSMSVGYDEYDRVVSVTDYAGKMTIYEYDKDYPENIKRVAKTIGGTEYSATYSYYTLSAGPLFGDGATVESVIYSNGVKLSYKYGKIGNGEIPKLKFIEAKGSKGVISLTGYGYDELGRISSLSQSSETDPFNANCNNTKYFTYNLLGEILSETVKDKSDKQVSRTKYTRDLNGNIVSKDIYGKDGEAISKKAYKYNEINQLLRQEDTVSKTVYTYEYDNGKTGNGNLTCIRKNGNIEKQFAYNSLNQLTEYKDNHGVDVCYEYNAESLRKCKYFKDHPEKKILYYYSPENGEIVNEEDSADKLMTSYLEAGGKMLRAVGNSVEWYIKNGKDVVAIVDKEQSKANTYNYNAYGEDTDLNNGGTVIPQKKDTFNIKDNPYKYSGYYIDEESGMYYLQARYYSPEIMRFISWDTYDVSNRYAYCEGNPISKVDPNGHMSQGAAMGITSAVDVASMVAETALGAIPFVGPILSIIFGVISSAGSEALYQGLTGGIKDPAAIGIAAGIGLALGGGLGVLGKVAAKFKWAAKLKGLFKRKEASIEQKIGEPELKNGRGLLQIERTSQNNQFTMRAQKSIYTSNAKIAAGKVRIRQLIGKREQLLKERNGLDVRISNINNSGVSNEHLTGKLRLLMKKRKNVHDEFEGVDDMIEVEKACIRVMKRNITSAKDRITSMKDDFLLSDHRTVNSPLFNTMNSLEEEEPMSEEAIRLLYDIGT